MKKAEYAPIIIGKLLNIGGMLNKHGNEVLPQYDLNQHQFSILFEIFKAEKVRQKEMINRLELEKAHVSKVVKKLHKMELVKIVPSKEDKRSAWLSPTKKGKVTVKSCMKIFEKLNSEWINEFDEKQLSVVLESLTLLQSVFREKIIKHTTN